MLWVYSHILINVPIHTIYTTYTYIYIPHISHMPWHAHTCTHTHAHTCTFTICINMCVCSTHVPWHTHTHTHTCIYIIPYNICIYIHIHPYKCNRLHQNPQANPCRLADSLYPFLKTHPLRHRCWFFYQGSKDELYNKSPLGVYQCFPWFYSSYHFSFHNRYVCAIMIHYGLRTLPCNEGEIFDILKEMEEKHLVIHISRTLAKLLSARLGFERFF